MTDAPLPRTDADSSIPHLPTEDELRQEYEREIRAARAAHFARVQALVQPLLETDECVSAADAESAAASARRRPAYYCWLPARTATFKRSRPEAPDFCVVLARIDEPIPSIAEMRALRELYAPCTIRFAIVPTGDGAGSECIFMDMNAMCPPDLSAYTESTVADAKHELPRLKLRRIRQGVSK